MSDSVFIEESDSVNRKTPSLDAVSPLSSELSTGGLEVFLEEEEQRHSSGVNNGGLDTEQNGLSVINGSRGVSVSPKPTNNGSTNGNGKNKSINQV